MSSTFHYYFYIQHGPNFNFSACVWWRWCRMRLLNRYDCLGERQLLCCRTQSREANIQFFLHSYWMCKQCWCMEHKCCTSIKDVTEEPCLQNIRCACIWIFAFPISNGQESTYFSRSRLTNLHYEHWICACELTPSIIECCAFEFLCCHKQRI